MNQEPQREQEQQPDHGEELELLRRVLEPLGERRCAELLSLADDYLEQVSPLTWMAGQSEPGEENDAVSWKIGESSPLDKDATVFALFYEPDLGAGVAYTFKAIMLEGHPEPMATYQREFIYNPRYGTGPIALNALFEDLKFHLTEHKDAP